MWRAILERGTMTETRWIPVTKEQKRSLVEALIHMPPFGERSDICDLIELWNASDNETDPSESEWIERLITGE